MYSAFENGQHKNPLNKFMKKTHMLHTGPYNGGSKMTVKSSGSTNPHSKNVKNFQLRKTIITNKNNESKKICTGK